MGKILLKFKNPSELENEIYRLQNIIDNYLESGVMIISPQG